MALSYAARGWRVFPCRPSGKEPLTPHGCKDATADEATIRAWWARWRDANLGATTGAPSGVVVLDVDKKHGIDGEEALRVLEAQHGALPDTVEQITGSGGRQLLFRHPGGIVSNSASKLGLGFDVRGDGGYVIVPPSIHPNGHPYEWELSHHPDDTALADLPPEWAALLQAQNSTGTRAHADTDSEPIPEGKRNDALFRLASGMRAHGMSHAAIESALLVENAERCQPPLPEEEIKRIAGSGSRYEPRRDGEAHSGSEQPPWALAKSAPDFLAEEEKEFTGIARDLVAPGVVTLIASPKGIGKTQVVHALAVALGSTSGVFRGERVTPCRVLLLDRENARAIVKQRLRKWGAVGAKNLHILTRQDAPDLKDRAAWKAFPVEQYDVVIVDSVGASTEGITEKEGRQTTEVLATLQDLATRGVAIVLLQNTEKTGTNVRGRGEWVDRADIFYEVRDATGFTPSGKRPWWLELPVDGAADWAERAARRKGRTDYRLAFIPAKFRLAAEPEPFCLEISLPENEPWTLRDVTDEILKAGEETVAKVEQEKSETLKQAAAALAEVVIERAATEDPILKKQAKEYLHEEGHLSRDAARAVVQDNTGKLWRIEKIEGKPGHPKALYPPFQTVRPPKYDPSGNPHETRAGEAGISAGIDSKARRNTPSQKDAPNGLSEDTLFRRADSNATAEIGSQKRPSNKGYSDTGISADEEFETGEPEPEDAEVIE